MLQLTSIVSNPAGRRPHQPLIVLQSSASQTCLPVLRKLISSTKSPSRTLLFCFLYPPSALTAVRASDTDASLQFFDYTGCIPGYDAWSDPRQDILAAVQSASTGPLNVVIDSADTLASNIASDSQAFRFLHDLFRTVSSRLQPSVLVLHLLPCPLLSLLTQTSLSSTLTHVIAHPPALITHLATAYFAPPPPAGPAEKFWGVFIPISERAHEIQRLVYGPDGNGTCTGAENDVKEFVVELIIRGSGAESRKRTTQRTLEAWKGDAPASLEKLECLLSIFSRKQVSEKPSDPTENVSFNLHLTPAQERSRARVPLPYAHAGKPITTPSAGTGAIFYEPDSADDIDEDDPDEDLDI